MNSARDEIVALLPAAGTGSRMGGEIPKQYLALKDDTVLGTALARLLAVPLVSRVVITVASAESERVIQSAKNIHVTTGGDTRAESVLNGLYYIRDSLNYRGRVLVHDAARPCVRVEDISRLIDAVADSPDGGILAIPVHDTLKRADAHQCVEETVSRDNMWRAVTPQLFPLELLIEALLDARDTAKQVTDEASAMELAGFRPQLVAGAADNIKITVADDLALARTILNSQEST